MPILCCISEESSRSPVGFRACLYLPLHGRDRGGWRLDPEVSFAGTLASLDDNLPGTVVRSLPLRKDRSVSVKRAIFVAAQ